MDIPTGYTQGPWFVSGVRFRMDGKEWHGVNHYDPVHKLDENVACVGYDPRNGAGLADAHLISLAPMMAVRIDELERQIDHMVNCYHPEFGSEWCPEGMIGAILKKKDEEIALLTVERIVAAACQKDGLIFSKPAPARHHNVLWEMSRLEGGDKLAVEVEQGFLTSTGRFVDRTEALGIATAAGQLIREPRSELFSEEVW